MRIHAISDTHDEIDLTTPYLPVATGELKDLDFVVLAGDIGRGVDIAAERLMRDAAQCPIVRILGNHEAYKTGNTVPDITQRYRKLFGPEVLICFLENDNVVLKAKNGELVKFIGSTLWTDFKLYADQDVPVEIAMESAKRLNDYHLIVGERNHVGLTRRLTPEDTLRWHQTSVEYIVGELEKPFDGLRVVVTHHSPVRGCLNPAYQKRHQDRVLSPSFGSDLSWICEDDHLAPDLWISGHGHNSFDFEIGMTRMVGNPVGYGRENLEFDPHLVVDTEMLPRFRV
ncbi:metallophosphoesterase [Roseibium album]|uniref:metallophosphoesterase n=1 Tax=Roseibium album TaxID=311410 RepID=UPI003BAF0EF7